jgi:hypothetical protein
MDNQDTVFMTPLNMPAHIQAHYLPAIQNKDVAAFSAQLAHDRAAFRALAQQDVAGLGSQLGPHEDYRLRTAVARLLFHETYRTPSERPTASSSAFRPRPRVLTPSVQHMVLAFARSDESSTERALKEAHDHPDGHPLFGPLIETLSLSALFGVLSWAGQSSDQTVLTLALASPVWAQAGPKDKVLAIQGLVRKGTAEAVSRGLALIEDEVPHWRQLMWAAASEGNLEAVQVLQGRLPAGERLGSLPMRRAAEHGHRSVVAYLAAHEQADEAIRSYLTVRDTHIDKKGVRTLKEPHHSAIRMLADFVPLAARPALAAVFPQHLPDWVAATHQQAIVQASQARAPELRRPSRRS